MNNLATERERQLSIHLEAGVHKALGITKDNYISSFPEIDVPESLSGADNFPLIITTISSLPLDVQVSFIGGVNHLGDAKLEKVREPYAVWINGALDNRGISPVDVMSDLSPRVRAGTISEGIFHALVNPKLVIGYAMSFPSTHLNGDEVASLVWFGPKPRLDANWKGHGGVRHGSLIAQE